MKYKIRKGIESPLKIFGMEKKYFYAFMGLIAILLFVMVAQIMNLSKNASISGFVSFLIFLIFSFFVILVTKFVFTLLSDKSKLKFGKKRNLISNKDFPDLL
jgi:hypothetical protein